ncbi:MAG: hypothetical protein EOP49_31245 [Sphingobacteriales bacterium]|nr:MAG: hypothetical protein EOP49_31245 [Sphingobacteriales bacterium]
MDHKYISQLKQLRDTIAIGVSEGLQLLKAHDGNMEAMISSFKKQSLDKVLTSTRQHESYVLPLLEQHQYDSSRVIEMIEDQLSLVQGAEVPSTLYYLHKFRNDKSMAVTKIAELIIHNNKLERMRPFAVNAFPWFYAAEMAGLNAYDLCVVSLTEWLDYEEQEPFSSVIHYNTDLVTRQMELIGLPELARDICCSAAIAWRKNKSTKKGKLTGTTRTSLYHNDKKFREALKRFSKNKVLLIEHLYDYISANQAHFS